MDETKRTALRKGLLEYLILAIASNDRVYAADILERLQGTDFATQEGPSIPCSARCAASSFSDHEWRESASGPPRKYYGLTEAGWTQLTGFRAYWGSINDLIDKLGRSRHAPSH